MNRRKFVPERLKAKREALGLSMSELADKAGVSKDDISNAEAGRVKGPKYLFMVGIAAALGEHPDYFFESDAVKIRQRTRRSSPTPAA